MNDTTSSKQSVAGRVAVVTGASSGIGSAIAERLASAGADALGRRSDELRRLASDAPHGRILPVSADITSDDEVQAALARIHDQLGKVDVLVNAAGVMLPNPLVDARSDQWATMISTNLTGLLRVTKTFLPDLISHAGKPVTDIVNISSIAAYVPFPDYAVYAATKAAVTTLSAMQPSEIGRHGVRVTNVEPELTDTDLGTPIDNPRLRAELQDMLATIPPMTAGDVADLVEFIVTRPPHVNLRHVVVLPTEQV